MAGPLDGVRVVELAGIGPGPFAAMMLSDMGAEVLRVDRADAVGVEESPPVWDVNARGRRSVAVDLKHPGGPEVVLRLVERADALIEGFRPGVTERLGLGPDVCLARRPNLVYGRMTGWGQEGPMAAQAGRDINYLALSGTLAMIGRHGAPPVPPLNLVADFGGGGMLLAFGIVCALHEAGRSGHGQVVDAAMVDGAALLAGMVHGLRWSGDWGERGTNLLDSGAWFYDAYETADGRYVAFGAIDPKAQRSVLDRLGLEPGAPSAAAPLRRPGDRSTWPEMKLRVAEAVRARTRDEWCAVFEGSDACFTPVLEPDEAPGHPHNATRGAFVEVAGVLQPAPAPRFSRSGQAVPTPPPAPGADTGEGLADWGFAPTDIADLVASGAIR